MSKEFDFSLSEGIPFRFYKAIVPNKRPWGIMLDRTADRFIPVLMLDFHKGVLEGIQSGLFTREDCGIYTSMLHNWMAFGITPEFIYVPMESVPLNGSITSVAMPFVQLKQKNEIGSMVSRVILSLSDAMIFSELLNTPILLSAKASETIPLKLIAGESVDDQVTKAINIFEMGT